MHAARRGGWLCSPHDDAPRQGIYIARTQSELPQTSALIKRGADGDGHSSQIWFTRRVHRRHRDRCFGHAGSYGYEHAAHHRLSEDLMGDSAFSVQSVVRAIAATTCSKPSGTDPTAGPTTNSPTAPSNGPAPPATDTPSHRAAGCRSPTGTPPPPPPNRRRLDPQCHHRSAARACPYAHAPDANNTTTPSPPNAAATKPTSTPTHHPSRAAAAGGMKASPPTFQSRGQADVDATALPTARGYRVGRVGEVRIHLTRRTWWRSKVLAAVAD